MKLPSTSKAVYVDTETDNVDTEAVQHLWCAVCFDLTTGEVRKFHPTAEGGDHVEFTAALKEYLSQFELFVGHNMLGYDAHILNRLVGTNITPENSLDTLVWSRILRPSTPPNHMLGILKRDKQDNRLGGHSLEAWGNRHGVPKTSFDDFSHYSVKMLEYCVQDVHVGVNVILKEVLKEQIEYKCPLAAIDLEQRAHWLLTKQSIAGFTLHKERAQKMVTDTDALIEQYTAELHKIFPPIKVQIETYKPKFNKDGTMSGAGKKKLLRQMHALLDDGTYAIYEMQTFNPNSPQQVGERLMTLGWNPRKFTATGQASTAKDVIGEAIEVLAAKYPQVEVLRKFNIVTDRNQKARKWLEYALKDGRVHGRVNHIGPWTHRCSHFNDNMANIAKVRLDKDDKPIEGLAGDFGWESRNCWIPKKGWTLVGCDASAIQLRALAHYMGDPEYIKEVVEGDIHTRNQQAFGVPTRAIAKTVLYAMLLGAGDEKIGLTVGATPVEYDELFRKARGIYRSNHHGSINNLLFAVCDKLRAEGRPATQDVVAPILKGYFVKRNFSDNVPAYKRFKEEDIRDAAKKGFMLGLDGRRIWIPSEHLAMGAYLQGLEAVVMKKALVLANERLAVLRIPHQQVAFVHDELQIEVAEEHASTLGKVVVTAIEDAGKQLGCLCPLTGEFRMGSSWAVCH
jgi:DNA polymerase I-like protein with 3'-5' exonuclease and polymerase domains